MTKWEYLYAKLDYAPGKGLIGTLAGELRIHTLNGQELGNWKTISIYEVLNSLGEQGWETAIPLVGQSAKAQSETTAYIFKRQMP